jgi:DNA primase
LSFDNDDAGTNANINIGKLLVQNDWNVSVVGTYDAAIKDVDELCNKKGASAIKQIVEERVDFFSFLISKTFKEKMPVDQKLDLLNTIL